METLDALWNDRHDEGIPFSSTVNEARVLEVLRQLSQDDLIDDAIRARTRHWIVWNRSINMYESEPFVTWVEQVYSHIESILSVRSDPLESNPDDDSGDVETGGEGNTLSAGDTRRS